MVLSVAVVVPGLVVGFGLSPVGAVTPAQTERVSVSSTGEQANGSSGTVIYDRYGLSISADGRFVAFTSNASNLVDADTNGASDVFVYDRTTQETERVSVSSTGAQANESSNEPSISADGRFVAFVSGARNLVADDTNGEQDVFVYDGTTQETERVSVSSTGAQVNNYSHTPAISSDGRFVAFQSRAKKLVDADTNGVSDVFVHDRVTHRDPAGQCQLDRGPGPQPQRPSVDLRRWAVRRVHLGIGSTLVRADTNGADDVYVHDRITGKTRRVSVSSTGTQADSMWDGSYEPSISAGGRFVAFFSEASNLVRADTNGSWDVFVRDRFTHTTRRVSVSSTGAQANGRSMNPSISAHGRFVAFTSNASNLADADTNGTWDVFVYDLTTHLTRRVSVSSTGVEGDVSSESWDPSISASGAFVAFASLSRFLVTDDTNGTSDVFVRGPLP